MPVPALAPLERYFEFKKLNTTWRTEILAGFTTFITMAYIVFVNPSILKDAGMPVSAVFAATCMAAAFGTILMGAFARYPIALAPGMGLNAYFTYTVVKGMGVPWQTALGAVFLSGVAFLILTVMGVRQWIIAAIPAGIVCRSQRGDRSVHRIYRAAQRGHRESRPGHHRVHGQPARSQCCARGVRHSVDCGAAGVEGARGDTGRNSCNHRCGRYYGAGPLAAANISLERHFGDHAASGCDAAVGLGLLEIVFVFLFVDLFDNIGTLMAVSKKAGLLEADNRIPRVNRILLTDAAATIGGSLLGTTTVTSYMECASGVAAGGRTGVTSIVTGLLFIAALFVAPIVGAVPSAATSPALVVVGGLMISAVGEIPWEDVCTAVPAFLTLVMIPLTFSIANGLACGIISYVVIHLARGRGRQVPWAAYVLAVLLIFRFVYIGSKT